MTRQLFQLTLLLSLFGFGSTAYAAQCEHIVTNHWGSGFQADIVITNTDSTPITDWSLTWGYSDGTTVTNVWNAESSGTNPVNATPLDWFVSIPPGGSWSIGLNANGAGDGVTLSGDICDSSPPAPVNFQLAKAWDNGLIGDAITATTTGLGNNATLSSTSTGSNTDTGSAVTVNVGDVFTLPTETFTSGVASDYAASDWVCDDNANSVIPMGSSFTVAPADAGNTVTCTIENEYIDPGSSGSSNLSCEHVITNNWGSGFTGQIQITNTSTSPVTDWSTTWSYTDSTSVNNVWDGIGNGTNPVTATPPEWFDTLAPGGDLECGFLCKRSGSYRVY